MSLVDKKKKNWIRIIDFFFFLLVFEFLSFVSVPVRLRFDLFLLGSFCLPLRQKETGQKSFLKKSLNLYLFIGLNY